MSALPRAFTRERLKFLGLMAALAVAYFLAGKAGLAFSFVQGNVTLIWPPTGIAVAAVLLFGYRVWPGLALGAFIVTASTGAPLGFAAAAALGNPLQALGAVYLLRRFGSFDRSLARVSDVLWFVGLGAALSPVISATTGVAGLRLAGLADWPLLPQVWIMWWSGDAMGVLLLAPLLLTLRDWRDKSWEPRHIVEGAFLLLGTALVCTWVYDTPQGLEYTDALSYLTFPFVIWAGFRFEQRGATAVIFVTTAMAVWATASGRGPFAQSDVHASLLSLSGYLSIYAVAGMMLAAAVMQRRHTLAAVEIVHGMRDRTRSEELAAANGQLRAEIAKSRQSEDALRGSEERLKLATRMAGIGNCIWDAIQDRCIYCSEEYAGIHGTTVETYTARSSSLDGAFLFTHPEDRERVRAALKALRAGRRFDMEYRVLTPGGEARYVREIARPVFDAKGTVVQEHMTIQDITESKRVENKLRHTQKMEAVGNLTGGVAHDFNNLLAVILGNAEILQHRLGEDDRATKAILRAASRGAELTRQLLAFSRKQPLHPRTIELDAIVAEMSDLLERTLGETVEIRTSTAPGLWTALADPGQLENALLNLAINARDAMPDGGVLTIETANEHLKDSDAAVRLDASPGRYAVLAVGDTGCGMRSEVLERAFEPFFTTKDVGKGSGLGLSMVYGFVKQTGGHVTIHSEEGRGTTVKLYLPHAEAAVVRPSQEAATEPRGRGESILVLEDDPDVRKLAVSMLQDLGYKVLEAEDGKAALATLDGASRIDLLLSDVVLPGGMSGPEVAEQARRRHPALKVLFMSGYADTEVGRDEPLQTGAGFLEKPFHRHKLAQKVGAALEATPAGAGQAISLAS